MAKTYTAKLQVRRWKEHTCVNCGAVYSYLMTRQAVGKAASVEGARQNLAKSITRIEQRDTDMHACPSCGQYQPDMIGQRRARGLKWVLGCTIVVLIALLILRLTDLLQRNQLAWGAGGAYLLAALVAAFLEMRNPNRDTEGNRRVASERVGSGAVRHVPGTKKVNTGLVASTSRPAGAQVAMLLVLLSVGLAMLPELVRGAKHWPLNPECYPPVVGAGDEICAYMSQSITSIKSFWRGSPTVTLYQDANDLVGESLPAQRTNQNDWGSTIYAKSDEKNNDSHPWVAFRIPDSMAVAGKTLQVKIILELDYPQASGDSNFSTTHSSMVKGLVIQFASPHAGTQYESLWWGGVAGGGVLLIFCMGLLASMARRYARQAKPTTVTPA